MVGSLVGLSPYPVESATASRQMLSEWSLIVGHPADGVGEYLVLWDATCPTPAVLELSVRIISGLILSKLHKLSMKKVFNTYWMNEEVVR